MRSQSLTSLAALAIILSVSSVQAQMPSDPGLMPVSFQQAAAPADPAAPQPMPGQACYPGQACGGQGCYAGQACGAQACGTPSCGGGWFGGNCFTPCPWTFSADGLIMQRSAPSSIPLLTDSTGFGATVLDAHDLDFNTAGGWRVSALRQGPQADLEFTYFQLDGFEADGAVAGDQYVIGDVTGAALQMTAPWVDYRSRLYSGEMNVRCPFSGWLTLLAGLRYAELNERYSVSGADATTATTIDEVCTSTANRLYGFQIGADGTVFQYGCFSVQGLTKAGIYANHAKQESYQYSDAIANSGEASHSRAAFIGEVSLLGKYQFTSNFSVRAGYQLMWLDGVATATDQLNSNDYTAGTSSIDAGNTVFYHGAVVGAELTW